MTRRPARPRDAQAPAPREVALTLEGRRITAPEGTTVAAALIGAGIDAWRTTRRGGRPRGMFCGIGVCYDCLLTIDGFADQRACLVEVADGMVLGEPASDGSAPPSHPEEGRCSAT